MRTRVDTLLRLLLPTLLLSLLSGAVAAVPAAAQPAASLAARLAYTVDTLANGLVVVYHEDRTTPLVAVNIWYNVGAKHEPPGRTGFAHLFEHMMFKGSRNVADGQHWALLERAGARAGTDINGTTAHDRTNYFATVPSHQLALALWLEADRMGTLLETITPAKLENQREVVKNELRQGRENSRYRDWYEHLLARVFPEGHPYHHSIAGSMDDLSRATLDDVRTFFEAYYAPNNAVLVIAGDLHLDSARALTRRYFGGIARRMPPPPLPDMSLPAIIGIEQRVVIPEPRARVPGIYLGFRMPAMRDSLGPASVVLGGMLGGSASSALHRALVRTGIASWANATNIWLVDGADLLIVSAAAAAGVPVDSLERSVLRAIASATTSLSAPLMDRVKAGLEFQFVDNLQAMGGFGGRADRLAEGVTYYRDPDFVNIRAAKFAAVTLDQVQGLARERLVSLNRVTLLYEPTVDPRTDAATAHGVRAATGAVR